MNQSISLKKSSSLTDLLRDASCPALYQFAGIVGFALLTALGAQIRIYIWEVPFTLQTLFVYGSGLFLGSRNASISMLLYLALGLFLPVYAGDGYGIAYLMAASSVGYLIAFPFVAYLVGWMSSEERGFKQSLLSIIAGSLLLFAFGVTFLHFSLGALGDASWMTSIEKGWLRFIPADLAKIMLVAVLYQGSRKLF